MNWIVNAASRLTDGGVGAVPTVREENANGVSVVYVSLCADAPLCADAAVELTVRTPETVVGCLASELFSPFWCRPRFYKNFNDLPKDNQGLLWQEQDGRWTVLFPLVGDEYVCSFCTRDGKLTAVLRSFTDTLTVCDTFAFVAASGDDPYALLRLCAEETVRLLGGTLRLREERRYPVLFEYLGWCSWDSMEIWVNEAEILQKCAEFREKNIPVRWAILDDMWADIEWTQELPRFTPHDISFGVMHASKMRDFEADPVRFPHGLAHCIGKMKSDYGMTVGMWHPTPGYWAGLVKDSPADKKLAGLTVSGPDGWIVPDLSDAGRAYRYYAVLHSFFKECGADFVKVDNQSFLRHTYKNMLPVGRAAKNLHAGIEGSAGAYFDGTLINCMGMATENMLNRTNSAVSRCSGDFQPENREWFAKHLLQCAYNGLFQGQFYYNDWDMWWSDDGQAKKNSLLRALSGGPVYVSDRMDRSRPEIFRPLCFSDGRILRPDCAAVPTADCLVVDCTKTAQPFKVYNTAGKTAYVAAFNITDEEIAAEGTLTPAEIPGLAGDRFLLYEYFSGSWKVIAREEAYPLLLNDAEDYRLYSLTPVERGMAVIGDAAKFISVRAVTDQAKGFLRVTEGGILKLYSEKPITHAENQDGDALTVEHDGDLYVIIAKDSDTEIYYG